MLVPNCVFRSSHVATLCGDIRRFQAVRGWGTKRASISVRSARNHLVLSRFAGGADVLRVATVNPGLLRFDDCCYRNVRSAWKTGLLLIGAVLPFASFVSDNGMPAKCSSKGLVREVKLGSAHDFIEGDLYEIKVNNGRDKVLLSYADGKFFCTGAVCPHYGAPLAKGVVTRSHITCPWHDAEFDLKSGKCVNGPTTNPIWTYPVRVEGGDVLAMLPEKIDDRRVADFVKCKRKDETYIVVGGGPAAFGAMETLRAEGFEGRILVFSDEKYPPYDRVVLTKNLRCDVNDILLRPLDFYESKLDVELQLNKAVTSVDLTRKTVTTSAGDEYAFDKIVLCTGSSARRLNSTKGASASGIEYIRTIEGHEAFQRRLFSGPNDFRNMQFVIVGSSFIGVEVASSLKKLGVKRITIVGKDSVPFEGVLGKRIGEAFRELLKTNGVEFIPNVAVTEFMSSSGSVCGVKLSTGQVLQADRVIVGIGAEPKVPNIIIGREGRIERDRSGGISVTPFLNTKNYPFMFAAGDIASFPYIKTGEAARIEHYATALQQGRIAALNMLDKNVPYTDTPFFWSNSFNKGLRYAGVGEGFDDVIIEGDIEAFKFCAYYVKGDKVLAVCTMGKDPVGVAAADALQLNIMPSATELKIGSKNSEDILKVVKQSATRRFQRST